MNVIKTHLDVISPITFALRVIASLSSVPDAARRIWLSRMRGFRRMPSSRGKQPMSTILPRFDGSSAMADSEYTASRRTRMST